MRVRIRSIDRLRNSYSGNPRFRISWRYGAANTAADASYNYEIGNPGFRVGDLVDIELNGHGTIRGITRADGQCQTCHGDRYILRYWPTGGTPTRVDCPDCD